MTRVLFVGLTSPMETFLARLAKGLMERGFEVGVASTSRESLPTGVTFIKRSSTDVSRLRRAIDFSLTALSACSAPLRLGRLIAHQWRNKGAKGNLLDTLERDLHLARTQWDVYYIPWNYSAIAHDVVFELGSPVVISCRGSQINVSPHNPDLEHLKKALARTFEHAAAVHCVSEHIATQATHLGLDRKKATVIHPAVDVDYFRPVPGSATSERSELRLISVGSLTWGKAHTDTLEALSLLEQRGIPCRLEIVGSGDERDRLLFEASDLGVADRLTLSGAVDPEEIRNRLQQSDVFVLASLSEGISNAALEAMASGLPVVSTDVGGMREAIDNGENGLLVPSRSPKKLAEAIETLARDRELRHCFGQRARERAVADFDIKDQITRFANLFDNVARRAPQVRSQLTRREVSP